MSSVAQELQRRRDTLLMAVLPHVPFDGWSPMALRQGALDAGLAEGDVARLFPGGPIDAVAHFVDLADREMMAAMAGEPLEDLKIRARIALVIRRRLLWAAPYREAVRAAVALLAMPRHAALSMKLTARSVDAMWRAVGDRATDYSWYSKRALLAAVYGATLLYWLEDSSENFGDSWAFLDRRIDNVLRLPSLGARFGRLIPSPGRFWRRVRNH